MPAQNVFVPSADLAGFVHSDFINTYQRKYEVIKQYLAGVMELGFPSTRRTDTWSYPETAPYPRRWPYGEEITQKGFKHVTYTSTNYKWAAKVSWAKEDVEDEQTQSLRSQAMSAGENFATLHERIAFQIITGTTDNELLPAIPNAPDGAALYATTAGGSNRFGVSSGNLLTGTGVSSPQVVKTDFYNGIEQFRLFQDTEGQPYWDDSVLKGPFVIAYNAANQHLFQEAFVQSMSRFIVTNGAGSNVAVAGVSNIIIEGGIQVQLWPTTRVTDNDWYIFLQNAHRKPLFQVERVGLTSAIATAENSDTSRRFDEEYVQWRARYGYGVNLPLATVKINN